MKRYFRIFRDLLKFLPGRTPTSWEETFEVRGNRPIFILIPGFQARERTVSILRKRFLRDDFSVLVLSMDWLRLSDGVVGLYQMAKRLSEIVLKLRKTVGMNQQQIFLVGHSAGGLVARYYVQLLGGYHYCDGLVTLGTPHRGSWYAALGFFSLLIFKARCLFQMLPFSPFIRRLNQAYYPRHFKMVSLLSKNDDFSTCELSSLVPQEQKEASVEDIMMSELSHHDFLLSRQVYDTILVQMGLSAKVDKEEAAQLHEPA